MPTLVQKAIAASNSVAFASNNTAGNFLVCTICSGGDITNVTDTAGNTWTKAVDQGQAALLLFTDIWYAENCAAGANTVTLSGGFANFEHIAVAEYSGMATSTVLDQIASQNGNNTISEPDSSGTPTTTQADELLIGAIGNNSTRTVDPWGSSFTEQADQASNSRALSWGDRIVTVTDAYDASGTLSGITDWQCLIATFKVAAAAGGSAFKPTFLLMGVGT